LSLADRLARSRHERVDRLRDGLPSERQLLSLAEVIELGGTYFVAESWLINYIRATQFAINEMPVHKSRVWLALISRD